MYYITPAHVVFELGNTAVESVIITAILLLLVMMAFAWWRAGKIVAPIREVSEGLREVAQGEASLDTQLQYAQKDEIGTLVHWFNAFLQATNGQVKAIQTEALALDTISSHVRDIANNLGSSAQKQQGSVQGINDAFNHLVETAKEVIDSCGHTDENLRESNDAIAEGQKAIGANVRCVNNLHNSIEENTKRNAIAGRSTDQINGIFRQYPRHRRANQLVGTQCSH